MVVKVVNMCTWCGYWLVCGSGAWSCCWMCWCAMGAGVWIRWCDAVTGCAGGAMGAGGATVAASIRWVFLMCALFGAYKSTSVSHVCAAGRWMLTAVDARGRSRLSCAMLMLGVYWNNVNAVANELWLMSIVNAGRCPSLNAEWLNKEYSALRCEE